MEGRGNEEKGTGKSGGRKHALIYNIVTLRANGRATMNLKGPVVLNRYTLTGKQVVITNAAQYALQHPLPVVGATEN